MNYRRYHEMERPHRPYRQVARAAATAEARRRILRCFLALLGERPAEEITLDDVAGRAGTSRQTLIRYFGGKDGLMRAVSEQLVEDVLARRHVPAGSGLEDHMAALVADYDEIGHVIVQMLAQEARLPILTICLDRGRRGHRAWIASVFAPWLKGVSATERTRLLDQLYAVTDVNVWKLLRQDFGRSADVTSRQIAEMARKLVAGLPVARSKAA